MRSPAAAVLGPDLGRVTQLAAPRRCRCGGIIGADGQCQACRQRQRARSAQPLRPSGRGAERPSQVPPHTQAAVGRALDGGRPLETQLRAEMERVLGGDLSRVTVHDGPHAATAADALDAEAFATGDAVVFGAGSYAPETRSGRRTLGHELQHVLQARGRTSSSATVVEPADSPAEREARRAGERAGTAGRHASPAAPRAGTRRAEAGAMIFRQPRRGAREPDTASVLFVSVDRGANTVTFITTSGSHVYDLDTPTDIPAGGYHFGVAVHGSNVTLTPPASAGLTTEQGTFHYRIRTGQPNPATLLRGATQVTVVVTEGLSAAPSTTSTGSSIQVGGEAEQILSTIPVTFVAMPIGGPAQPSSSGAPLLSPVTAAGGMGLHTAAFGELSWLPSAGAFSSPYLGSLLPRPGVPLDRVLNVIPRDLTPPLSTYAFDPNQPITWLNQRRLPVELIDPRTGVARPYAQDELFSILALVRRYNENPASLSAEDLSLLRQAVGAHIGGSTPTSPFSSFSEPGQIVSWSGQRQYLVRVNVDRSAAIDVSRPNAFNQNDPSITNVEEAEWLVTGDQSGRIISVQRLGSGGAEVGWLMQNAGAIRWGGRLVMVAGLAYSGYRIAEASPEDRPRVALQEGGGQLGGFAGSAWGAELGAAGCIALGVATEGIGLLLCGLAGGAVGGIGLGMAGSAGGDALGGVFQRWAQEAAQLEFVHFQDLNPDATEFDYQRIQQQMDNFDTWGAP
jgi:hypothetical protein